MTNIANGVMLALSSSLAASIVVKVSFTTALALIVTRLARTVHQLGLNLEATRGPHQFLVVDHVERPSAN